MSTQSLFTSLPPRAALALVSATTAVFFAGVYAAHAWPGRSGEARSTFTVAGSLTLPAGATRPPMLRFVFHKAGAPDCALDTRADMGPTGDQFTAQIDYDACGRAFFDGSDVTADVLVNGAAIITGQPVNPVPYAHFASVAGVARQYDTPQCPAGYERNVATSGFEASSSRTLCQKFRVEGGSRVIADEVVRVGAGGTAFWIDRYEASVWGRAEGGGSDPYFVSGNVPPSATFNRNGQWSAPFWALSVAGTPPADIVSWYQAVELCRLSGKRLPTNEEWTVAARGTPDPTSGNDGSMNSLCNTASSTRSARRTGQGSDCVSVWGAQDMIGNLREYVADWGLAPRIAFNIPTIGDINLGGDGATGARNWGRSLTANDVSVGIVSTASVDGNGTSFSLGAPSALLRGGDFGDGVGAGVYAIYTDHAPTAASGGFRCVIPR